MIIEAMKMLYYEMRDLDDNYYKRLKYYMPKCFFKIYEEELYKKYMFSYTIRNELGDCSFMGIKIVEGYELAIILVHEDYPLFNDEKMFAKFEFIKTKSDDPNVIIAKIKNEKIDIIPYKISRSLS